MGGRLTFGQLLMNSNWTNRIDRPDGIGFGTTDHGTDRNDSERPS